MSGMDMSTGLCSPHRPAEESTAGAAVVLDHAGPVVLTQNQQVDRVGGSHHFLLHHSPVATIQLWRENAEGIHKNNLSNCITFKPTGFQHHWHFWTHKYLTQ